MVGLDAILSAQERIAGRIVRTRLVPSPSLSGMCGVPVGLKLEHHQTTGSFKLRGATNAVLSLTAKERTRGVVAASTGNHGRALAHAAKAEGAIATICMSELVPDNKVSEIRRLGANLLRKRGQRLVPEVPEHVASTQQGGKIGHGHGAGG